MRKPWNGKCEPYFEDYVMFDDEDGNKVIDIYYYLEDAAEFFGFSWQEMGYETKEEFDEDCEILLVIRYYPESNTKKWRLCFSISTPNYADTLPAGWIDLLPEEEKVIDRSIERINFNWR